MLLTDSITIEEFEDKFRQITEKIHPDVFNHMGKGNCSRLQQLYFKTHK